MNEREFLHVLHERDLRVYERAVGLLWLVGREDPTKGFSAREICSALEATGLPAQNVSRLNAKLAADRRISKAGPNGAWRLHPRARTELNKEYEPLLGPKAPRDSGSVIPTQLVSSRPYLNRAS